MDGQEDLTEYIKSLNWNNGQGIQSLYDGCNASRVKKNEKELFGITNKHGLTASTPKDFTDKTMQRMIFDGEKPTDLPEPLELSRKERRTEGLALMADLAPHLRKQAQEHEISGSAAYE